MKLEIGLPRGCILLDLIKIDRSWIKFDWIEYLERSGLIIGSDWIGLVFLGIFFSFPFRRGKAGRLVVAFFPKGSRMRVGSPACEVETQI